MDKSNECKPHLLHEHEQLITTNAPNIRVQLGSYLDSYVAYSARRWMDHVSTYTDKVEPRHCIEGPMSCDPHLRHSTAKIWLPWKGGRGRRRRSESMRVKRPSYRHPIIRSCHNPTKDSLWMGRSMTTVQRTNSCLCIP